MENFRNNENLQRIFEEQDLDKIATTLVEEVNRIVKDIASSNLVQVKKWSWVMENKGSDRHM